MDKLANRKNKDIFRLLMQNEDKIDEFRKDINFISEVIKKELQFKTIIEHPKPSKEEKKDMMQAVFKGTVSEEVLDFCYELIDLRMEKQLVEIYSKFDDAVYEKQGIVTAVAYTVIPMCADDITKLENTLTRKLKKRVRLSNKIDKSIMGGVVLKVGNKVIDSSVKSRLEEINISLNDAIIKL